MGRNVSLFSGYSQSENRNTNYCLLILKMLYEENPKLFSEIMGTLFDEQVAECVGVKFLQQEKRKTSTPDGLIEQKAFTIFLETKNFNWFYDDQLERHLSELNATNKDSLKLLIALSNFDSEESSKFKNIKELCATKYKGSIAFRAVSFQEFLDAIGQAALPKNLADTVKDLEEYLNEQNLLDTWMTTLDVVNCASTPDEFLDNVYMCPARGGAYKHRRCKYMGMYKDKTVSSVALIEAVAVLTSDTEGDVQWSNVKSPRDQVLSKAREKLKKWRPDNYPTQVFLLGNIEPTDFKKDTKMPMYGSKQYFDIAGFKGVKIDDAKDLALFLNDKTWTWFKDNTPPE